MRLSFMDPYINPSPKTTVLNTLCQWAIVALILSLVSATGKSTEAKAPPSPVGKLSESTGTVSFTLDGRAWTSSDAHPDSHYAVDAITDHATLVRIEAFAADGSFIGLTIFKQSGIGTGTYAITDPGMQGFYQQDPEAGGGYLTNGMPDNPGTVTITSLSREKVTGTFQFRLRSSGDPDDQKELTNGKFDVTFADY